MSLQLPGQLALALNMTGYEWPTVDEDLLGSSGGRWVAFGGTLHEHHRDATDAAGRVVARNSGADVAQMRESMAVAAEDGGDHARVALLIGGACVVGGALVLAWKVGIIGALVRLAVRIVRALSASAVSMGASLASLPLSVLVTRVAMRQTLRRIFPTRYLYDVDAPGGIDLQQTMGSALRTAHQREVAFPGGIEGRYIKGAKPYDPETGQFGEYIANPHYRP
ncbi:hypothetical protein ACIBHX_01295 [Nonomuraea sp. NPDC050536]|uniref:scabin-related ADP-ribosyltransferase n=1 Tax=Nonomuraea sp. NPDC050536 TaxID=3364366 RepID=UPI0037CA13BE